MASIPFPLFLAYYTLMLQIKTIQLGTSVHAVKVFVVLQVLGDDLRVERR